MSGFGLRWLFLRDAQRLDEEAAGAEIRRRRQLRRNRRLAADAFALSNREFIKTYRFTKSIVKELVTELKPYIPREKRNDSVDVNAKVLIALAFYASGSYQTLVGQNYSHSVSQSTVSRAIHQVTAALNNTNIFKKYVMFPLTREARAEVKRGFHSKFNFPGIVGCIDGTHVSIIKPSQHEEAYYCRKGYHSLNVMLICDSDLNIICVDPSSPGSTHDSTIWRDHPLNRYLNVIIDNGESVFLLGDSGYALRQNLITPVLNTTEGSREHWFYQKHTQTRNLVERTIGVLKARFRCLLVARQLHYKPEVAANIVNACCVLHNIANKARLRAPELPRCDGEEEEQLQVQHQEEEQLSHAQPSTSFTDRQRRLQQNNPLAQGKAVQQQIINVLWTLRN